VRRKADVGSAPTITAFRAEMEGTGSLLGVPDTPVLVAGFLVILAGYLWYRSVQTITRVRQCGGGVPVLF